MWRYAWTTLERSSAIRARADATRSARPGTALAGHPIWQAESAGPPAIAVTAAAAASARFRADPG